MRLNELILGMDDVRLQSGDANVDVRDLALDSRKAILSNTTITGATS